MIQLRIPIVLSLFLILACPCVTEAKKSRLPDSVIDCGKDKAVLFEGTKSPDGRYAIGWTIRVKDQKAAPVDWSLWDSTSSTKFDERHRSCSDQPDAPYQQIIGAIDLNRKVFADLPTTFPESLKPVTVWGPERNGCRYALVQKDAKFEFRFEAEIPKSMVEKSSVQGVITVRLPEETVVKASSNTPSDNPFESDPEVAKADKDLNQIYAELQKRLDSAGRANLKKEQITWLNLRSDVANQKAEAAARNQESDVVRIRNKALQDTTEERTAELNARLEKIP